MADQERVTIKINVRADTSQIDRVKRKLAELCAQAAACEKTFSDLNDRFDELDKRNKDLTKRIKENDDAIKKHTKSTKEASDGNDRNTRSMNRLSGAFKKFDGVLKGVANFMKKVYTFVLKAAAIETLAYAAALSSVNLLLKSGQFLAKGWQATVRGVGVAAANAAAGVAALAATFAAAMRQFAAAQNVSSYGGQFAAASRGLRAVQGDSQLAVFGIQSLTGAFAAASKNAKVTGQTVAGLRGLADFAVASGDMEKGLSAAASVISLLQSGKAPGSQEMLSAADQLGPKFTEAYKKVIEGGKVTTEELISMMASGELAKQAGVAGTAEAVQGTLIGQLKSFGSEIQVLAADIGNRFLPQVQEAFEEIRVILFRTFFQITGNLSKFASGPFVDTLVKAIDKLGNLTATLFNEYLPKTEEVINNFVSGWKRFTGFFSTGLEKFGKFLNEFSEASSVINAFFKEILMAVGGGLRDGFENFADLVLKNKDDLMEFGQAIGQLISKIFELTRAIRTAFMEALPVINKLVDAFGALISGLTILVGSLSSLGSLGAVGGVAAPLLLGAGMKGKGKVGKAVRGAAGTYGGTALTGVAASFMVGGALGGQVAQQSGSTGGAIFTGAAGGAATGAIFGATVGGPVGAAVGAAIGGIVGGISGWLSSNKFKKEVGDAAGQFAESYATGVQEDLISKGYFDTAQKKMDEFGKIAVEVAGGLSESEIFTKESANEWLQQQDELNRSLARGRGRMSDLAKITGLTEGEIKDLAQSFDIDLSDPLLTLQDVMKETGLVVSNFGDDFNAAISGSLGAGLAGVRQRQQLLQSSAAIDEITQTFREAAAAGTVTEELQLQLIEAAGVQAMLEGGGDPLKALDYFIQNIGAGGIQFGAGGSLEGVGGALVGGQGQAAIDQFISAGTTGLVDQIAANIISESAAIGMAVNADQLTTALRSMSPQQLLEIGLQAREAGFIAGQFNTSQISEADNPQLMAQSVVSTTLESLGLTNVGAEVLETAGDQLSNFVTEMKAGVETPFATSVRKFDDSVNALIAAINNQFGRDDRDTTPTAAEVAASPRASEFTYDPNTGTWTNQNQQRWPTQPPPDDTATPKSRLMRTLSSHYALSAGIPGSRSITSSLRNYNLGSMSSDHATGNALDLVGNNLGAYQQAMKGMGGYAEFHGGTNNRHLHVVPPQGDTASPAMVGGMSSGSVNYNITVNASPGMDERALADAVVRQIERRQQNMRERS